MVSRQTWIVVADGGRARILCHQGGKGGLEQVFDHDLVAPHGPNRAFDSDRPGHTNERSNRSRRAMEPPTESVRHAELELAARVAAELEQGRQRGMDHVILVAPPRTLGDLREAISKPVQRLVTAELGKDLSRLTPHQLMEHLADQLAKS